MYPQKQEVLCQMKSLADPTRLKPLNKRDGLLQVIIETPAGSRNKFAFDRDQKTSHSCLYAFTHYRQKHYTD
jgi:hypothetical protein